MSRGNSPFDRWAERKRAVARQEAATAAPAPEPVETGAQATEAALPEAELLEKLGLPDPDTLEEGADFAAFLRDGVPDFLRRRALRRLWLSNPALANLDGLLDYGEDFTDAATVPEVIETVYRVGRGMLRPKPDPAAEDVAEQPAADAEPAPAAPGAEGGDPAPQSFDSDESDINLALQDFDKEEETPVFTPRRMQFSYD